MLPPGIGMLESATKLAALGQPAKDIREFVPAPGRATIIHVLDLVHKIMANLVPRIGVISQIGGDEAHKFLVICIRLAHWVWIVVGH